MFFHAADIKRALADNGVTLIGALHPAARNGKPEYIAYIEPLCLKHPHNKCNKLMGALAELGLTTSITYSVIASVTGTSYPPDGAEELRIVVYPARK